MTKTETYRLQQRVWKLSITRRKKTKEYRETMALLRMGQIIECRMIRKLADAGSTAWLWRQFPGELTDPVRIDPDKSDRQQIAKFQIIGQER